MALIGIQVKKSGGVYIPPPLKASMLTQEQLLAFNVIQRRLTRHNVTLRFNDQTREVINIADHNRANHRTRIGVEVCQIHFKDRLTCRQFSALFHQAGKALATQRDGINAHMNNDLRAFFRFQAERMVRVEDFYNGACRR